MKAEPVVPTASPAPEADARETKSLLNKKKWFPRLFIFGMLLIMGSILLNVFIGLRWFVFVPALLGGIALCAVGFIFGLKADQKLAKKTDDQLLAIAPPVMKNYFQTDLFLPNSFVVSPQANNYWRGGSCKINGAFEEIKFSFSNLHLKAQTSNDSTTTVFQGWCLSLGDGSPVTDERLQALRDALQDYRIYRLAKRIDVENEILLLVQEPALFTPEEGQPVTEDAIARDCMKLRLLLELSAAALKQTA